MSSPQKIALVTGAGSGIGKACAIGLAQAGFTLALSGRRAGALEETAAEIRSGNGKTLVAPADITDPQAVVALFAAVRERFGRLDLLFNNAGCGAPPAPLEDLDLAAWRRALDVNVTGAFLCTQQAFRLMKEQRPLGGRIINNGSISAHSPRPRSVAYTTAKHAITGLTKSTALDGRAYDIACGQIDIGNASTEMTQIMRHGVPQADGRIAPEALIELKHVADAVVYMASLPLAANVQFMTVMATKMPFIGRG